VTCTSISPDAVRAASASTIGVDRDPGATTAWRIPHLIHSSINVAHIVAAATDMGITIWPD
jgi:hypothetical protein